MYHCAVKECFACWDTVVTFEFLPMDINLYIENVALYYVYAETLAIVVILLRNWYQKGEKKNEQYRRLDK